MDKGIVLWYSQLKGFGMIESLSRTIFVHKSQLPKGIKHLCPGDKVEFDVYMSTIKPNLVEARNIKIL